MNKSVLLVVGKKYVFSEQEKQLSFINSCLVCKKNDLQKKKIHKNVFKNINILVSFLNSCFIILFLIKIYVLIMDFKLFRLFLELYIFVLLCTSLYILVLFCISLYISVHFCTLLYISVILSEKQTKFTVIYRIEQKFTGFTDIHRNSQISTEKNNNVQKCYRKIHFLLPPGSLIFIDLASPGYLSLRIF